RDIGPGGPKGSQRHQKFEQGACRSVGNGAPGRNVRFGSVRRGGTKSPCPAHESAVQSDHGFVPSREVGMRSMVLKAIRTAAPVLLVVTACTFATGCDSMYVGDWDPCGAAPCAKPCAEPCAQSGNCGAFPAEAKPGEAWC